jgi:hypothetical protein
MFVNGCLFSSRRSKCDSSGACRTLAGMTPTSSKLQFRICERGFGKFLILGGEWQICTDPDCTPPSIRALTQSALQVLHCAIRRFSFICTCLQLENNLLPSLCDVFSQRVDARHNLTTARIWCARESLKFPIFNEQFAEPPLRVWEKSPVEKRTERPPTTDYSLIYHAPRNWSCLTASRCRGEMLWPPGRISRRPTHFRK